MGSSNWLVVGTFYTQTCTASGGTPPYHWSVPSGPLPSGLSLSATTGSVIAISGTPNTNQYYSYFLQVVDSTTPTAQVYEISDISGYVYAPPLTMSCSPVTGPVAVGAPYSAGCTVSGGAGEYFFSISAGALPAGLSLGNLTGEISGTPTTPGSYSYTVTVTDQELPLPLTAWQLYSGTIQSSPAITIQTSPSGRQFSVDGGAAQTAPQTLSLSQGSHTIAVASPQAGGA
ncbi:MAG: Ig domain-containing protein, partial [Bryobacteraceae bacterium]